MVRERTERAADLIPAEIGLCKKDSVYEIGRVSDVLNYGASEGAARRRPDLLVRPHAAWQEAPRLHEAPSRCSGVIRRDHAVRPPNKQVAHKVAPSIVTNDRMVLKPSEKMPLSAIAPRRDPLRSGPAPRDAPGGHRGSEGDRGRADRQARTSIWVTFTGGVAVGKYIASKAGYRRMVLELGGNDPIIVMEDADLAEAASLAAPGSYKNWGQRCTAVKRMLVHELGGRPLRRAAPRGKTQNWSLGDPPTQAGHGHGDRRGRRTLVRGRA